MRRGIAEHMRRSLDTGAHVTSAIEVDFSRIVAVREKLKKEYQAAYGVNPTYLAFVAKATVETLRDYPYVNAEMRGDSIVTRNFVNLGIAVELADGKGLIVPVIRNAEGLNLLGLARGIVDIANKARNKQLVPDDVQGGTFTITNPGGYGTFHGTPVISQPQSAILGTYALVKRAVGRRGRARPGRDRDPADDEHHAHVRPPPRRRRATRAASSATCASGSRAGRATASSGAAARPVPRLRGRGRRDRLALRGVRRDREPRRATDRRRRARSSHAELELEGSTIFLSTPAGYVASRQHRESCEIERAMHDNPWVIDGLFVEVGDVDDASRARRRARRDDRPRARRAGHRLPDLHRGGPRGPPLDVRPAPSSDLAVSATYPSAAAMSSPIIRRLLFSMWKAGPTCRYDGKTRIPRKWKSPPRMRYVAPAGTGRGSWFRFAIALTALIAVSPISSRTCASGKSPSSSSSRREHASICRPRHGVTRLAALEGGREVDAERLDVRRG